MNSSYNTICKGFEPIVEVAELAALDGCDDIDDEAVRESAVLDVHGGPADQVEDIENSDLASAFDGGGPGAVAA